MQSSNARIKVTILDDHQGILDGYLYRLENADDIEIVAMITYGEALEKNLSTNAVDVLILDVQVPISPNNHNPYPILYQIPKLLQIYPDLKILVISMHTERTLIQAAMNSGARGFILKDDNQLIKQLPSIVRCIHGGGIFLSEYAYQFMTQARDSSLSQILTSRQIEALSLTSAYPDESLEEIAQKMNIAHSTFRNLLSEAYVRLEVGNKTAAIEKARQLGLITQIIQDTRPIGQTGKSSSK
ncbi:MAG: response regulator transcription factor [Anaerolineales bacterium]|nr:response regulator transcription factor [Anaerolineales bacterium]